MAETGLQNINDRTLLEAARFHGLDAPAAPRTFGQITDSIRLLAGAGRSGGFDGVSDATLQEAAAFHGIETRPFGKRIADTVTGFVSDTFQGAKNLITGDTRRSIDAPELPDEIGNLIKRGEGQLDLKMGLARGDLGKLDIFRKFFPNAPAEIDRFGNVLVTFDEKTAEKFGINPGQFYLNKPGASPQDVVDIGTTIGIELPFAARGGQLLKGLGIVGKAVGTGLGIGTGSILQDVAAQDAGSNEPIDFQTALIATAFGGAFEFAAPLLKPFFGRFFKDPKLVVEGEVTDAGRKVLKNAGIDPDEITAEFAQRFQDLAKDAVDPSDLAGAARRAQAGEFEVPLSQGDATGSVVQQGREDLMLKGALGEEPANTLTGFRTRQSDKILEARGRVQQDIGGQGLEPFEGTRAAQEALAGAAQADKAAIREAFTVAGEKKASVLAEGVRDLARSVRQNFRQSFNPATAPKASKLADQLSNFEKAFPGRVKSVNVRTLEQFRQQVSALTRSSDPIERAAAANIRKSFDEFMEGAIDKALIQGDTEAIEAFAKARGLRREFGRKFEGDAILERLISEADGTLLLEPSEAARFLFGAGKLGGKTGATKALRRIKGILGVDSPEWRGLREEAFLRLFPDDAKAISKFPGAFDKAFRESPELMKELFSRAEIAKLRRFRAVIVNVTQKATGAVNFSNTAVALSRLAQDVFGAGSSIPRFVANLPIVQGVTRAVRNTRNAGSARDAVGLIARGQGIGPPPGLTGTLGSIGATDDRDQPRPGKALRALPSRRAALPSSIGPPTLASALLQNQGTPSPADRPGPANPNRNPNNLAAALLRRSDRPRQPQKRALMIGP